MTDLKENLDRLMKERGFTQKSLALAADLGDTAVRDILKGKSKNPTGKTLNALAATLGVDVAQLFGAPPDGGLSLETPERPATIPAGDVSTGAITVDELDVRASGGYGIVHEVTEAEPVTNRWQMPRDILKAQTSAPASSLKIITVYGDSMAPDFMPGERVLVDTSDRRPSPPGVFVLWDGLALVIKRLEVLPGAQTIRIIPTNTHYATYEQPLADVQINGRVIGKWQWT